MKKPVYFFLLFFMSINVLSAQFRGPNGPSEVGKVVPVSEANKLPDDSQVILEGRISGRISREKYYFEDASGRIQVEIDDDKWYGQKFGPTDPVRIWGEVDYSSHSRRRSIEIDVDHIEAIAKQ